MKAFRVLFQPDGRTVDVERGSTLLDAARKAGLHLNSPCGGVGTCGNCKVQLTAGKFPPLTERELALFRREEIEHGLRLACQVRVTSSVTCLIPDETRLSDQKILETGLVRSVAPDPAVAKTHLVLAPPSLDDQRADADRLLDALASVPGGLHVPLHTLRGLPALLRHADFSVTAASCDGQLLCVEPGDTTSRSFGVAVDVGTTTVVATLIDLVSAGELAVASRTNPQVAYGDDVVTRIACASGEKEGLATLHSAIVACINDVVHELTSRARVHPSDVYELLAVGNTTMMHLLLGVDPFAIAQAPYVAAYRRGLSVSAAELGLKISRCGLLTVLPNVAGFVGADTVAVALATEMLSSTDLTLAVDIGTNGEIVLGARETLVACSTAAGPAFEGARIKFGMRAAAGAIEAVDIDSDVRLRLIAGDKVVGLCGTGLIDAVAELLRLGIIDPSGRVLDPSQLPSLPEPIARRIRPGDHGNDFVLAWPHESQNGEPVYLTQRDVREVQLAKGAIFTGVQLIRKELGVATDDIRRVLLAGAFGNFLRPERALRIGLLPDVPLDRIRFVGNAASTGAKLALTNRACRAESDLLSRTIRYVELAGRPDFQNAFSQAILFPEK